MATHCFVAPFLLCLLLLSDLAAINGELTIKDGLPTKHVKQLARKFLKEIQHVEVHHPAEKQSWLSEKATKAKAEQLPQSDDGSQSCYRKREDDLCSGRLLQAASTKQTKSHQKNTEQKIPRDNYSENSTKKSTQSFSEQYTIHSHQDSAELTGMDYSPAQKRPPIHH
eukprot:TRINITY_DN931_c0_g1_i2.p1 TRINITY_DN931_c0_g1~~TRINITY_DN931_c0_g1_i2.p1  ORF type:complete len:168 (-),score=34.14 TRINITY_DN931_c0_g1_i2:349-852(-)